MSGIFGTVLNNNCSNVLYYGTDYHSHLGTEFGGMAVHGATLDRRIHAISQSQFKSKFYTDYHQMKGNKGIGVISDRDEQPIYLDSKFGPFCIVTAGLIENKNNLKQSLFGRGNSFSEMSKESVNSTELVAKMISLGDNIEHGIEQVFKSIQGSCSLLLLNKDGIYAARDRFGYTPLVLGKNKNGWAVSMESSAFLNMNFDIKRYLKPGEIILINEKGIEVKRQGDSKKQICSFMWIYTGFPTSNYEDINVEMARERCGRNLAKKDKDIDIDFVAGVPDSGTAHAIGYTMESGKPYRRPLIKYTPGYGRSYTPPSQETRDIIATMKLIPNHKLIKGNKMVLCEDSIVRGTQLKNYTINKLWDAGAEEVHVRAACPPLMFPCKYCLSTKSINELAARKAIKDLEGRDIEDISEYLDPESEKYEKMIEWIRKDIDVTTLRYQTIEDMIKAIGLPREKLCLYCWNGTEYKEENQKESPMEYSQQTSN
ncbi:MAG: amidophosphoribosyltransferase [Atribacterota bacterium]